MGLRYYPVIHREDVPSYGFQGASSEVSTTNNRIDLMAIIEGLKAISFGSGGTISTASQYTITVAYSSNPKLKNHDLSLRLCAELSRLKPRFQHVYGHAGHPENEQVDRLASKATVREKLSRICKSGTVGAQSTSRLAGARAMNQGVQPTSAASEYSPMGTRTKFRPGRDGRRLAAAEPPGSELVDSPNFRTQSIAVAFP